MVKIKLSKNQKAFSTKENSSNELVQWKKRIPMEFLLNEDNIAAAIQECIQDSDLEGLIEIIEIYLTTLSRAQLFKKEEAPAIHAAQTPFFFNQPKYIEIEQIFKDTFHVPLKK